MFDPRKPLGLRIGPNCEVEAVYSGGQAEQLGVPKPTAQQQSEQDNGNDWNNAAAADATADEDASEFSVAAPGTQGASAPEKKTLGNASMAVMVTVVAVAGDAVRSLEDIKQQLEEPRLLYHEGGLLCTFVASESKLQT